MYCSRPRTNQSHIKSVEFNIIAVTTIYYMNSTYHVTIAMRWFGIELTWTSPIAITRIQVVRMNLAGLFLFWRIAVFVSLVFVFINCHNTLLKIGGWIAIFPSCCCLVSRYSFYNSTLGTKIASKMLHKPPRPI